MIVDDEIIARVGMKSLIDWGKHGFEMVGDAENGAKALELAKEVEPDIIITDIRMPVMDGIELIRAVNELNLGTRFIVLSSYDDFVYVKQAMKLGAEDYLLKLELEAKNLLAILNITRLKIRQERKQTNNIGKKKEAIDDATVDKSFKDLLFGYSKDYDQSLNQIKRNIVHKIEDNVICLSIQLLKREHDVNVLEKSQTTIHASISDTIKQIIPNYGQGRMIYLGKNNFVIICAMQNSISQKNVTGVILKFCNDIIELLKYSLNIAATVGASNIHSNIKALHLAYKESQEAVESGSLYCPGRSSLYAAIKQVNQKRNYIQLEEELVLLEDALKKSEFESVKKIFEDIKSIMQVPYKFSRKSINGICHMLIFIIKRYVVDNKLDITNVWREDPYEMVHELSSIEEYIDWVNEMQINIFKQMNDYHNHHFMIIKIKKYISENFNKDISLQDAANYLNLSSGYFSRFFSGEMGETFTDYIIKLRIEHAKELIKASNFKIYEIAEMVGYENQHYFSRIFKKVTGLTPQQYKSNKGK